MSRDPIPPGFITGSRPIPDPTALTDAALARLKEQMEQYVDGKVEVLDTRNVGADRATAMRLATLDHIPSVIDEKVLHVRELATIQVDADRVLAAARTDHLREVDDIRFLAAERLAARESELNALALAAAFAAQKEASAKEAEYTRIASIKSESATAQAIDKLGELFATQTRGLGDKVDDLKDRVGRIESVKVGNVENRTGMYAALGVIGTILGILIILSRFLPVSAA